MMYSESEPTVVFREINGGRLDVHSRVRLNGLDKHRFFVPSKNVSTTQRLNFYHLVIHDR